MLTDTFCLYYCMLSKYHPHFISVIFPGKRMWWKETKNSPASGNEHVKYSLKYFTSNAVNVSIYIHPRGNLNVQRDVPRKISSLSQRGTKRAECRKETQVRCTFGGLNWEETGR